MKNRFWFYFFGTLILGPVFSLLLYYFFGELLQYYIFDYISGLTSRGFCTAIGFSAAAGCWALQNE